MIAFVYLFTGVWAWGVAATVGWAEVDAVVTFVAAVAAVAVVALAATVCRKIIFTLNRVILFDNKR